MSNTADYEDNNHRKMKKVPPFQQALPSGKAGRIINRPDKISNDQLVSLSLGNQPAAWPAFPCGCCLERLIDDPEGRCDQDFLFPACREKAPDPLLRRYVVAKGLFAVLVKTVPYLRNSVQNVLRVVRSLFEIAFEFFHGCMAAVQFDMHV